MLLKEERKNEEHGKKKRSMQRRKKPLCLPRISHTTRTCKCEPRSMALASAIDRESVLADAFTRS